jgi:CSLREA domain-containing protein
MFTSWMYKFLRAFVICGCIVNLMITPVKSAPTVSYTVNSLSDPGDGVCNIANCTLREAINTANGTATSDVIQFSLSGTITLGSSLPGILSTGGALTIDGAGRNIIVSGAGSYRHFFINTGAKLTLKNLDLKNGYSGAIGGGIYNKGNLAVENSTIKSNHAENDGGGIYSEGTLTLDNVSVSNNTTYVSNGGGLYIESGEAHIIDCNFQGNTATYSGGAIYNDGDLDVYNTTFSLNSAFGGKGGAIFTESGFQINQSTFVLNSAEDDGGAIATNLASGSIYRSVFYYNFTTIGDGGGIFINNNYSSSAVGIYDCSFELNDANSDGGGFYLVRGPLYIIRSLFDDNHADGDGLMGM